MFPPERLLRAILNSSHFLCIDASISTFLHEFIFSAKWIKLFLSNSGVKRVIVLDGQYSNGLRSYRGSFNCKFICTGPCGNAVACCNASLIVRLQYHCIDGEIHSAGML